MIESMEPIRWLAYISLGLFLAIMLVRWIRKIRKKIALIDAIPGPPRFSFLLGNIPMEILKHVGGDFEDAKELYYNLVQGVQGHTHIYNKEGIFRIWLSTEPWVILFKPESVEQVLSNNFLLEKSTQYEFLQPWLGTGLLTSWGQKWRSRRKMLVPAFHFKILHDFVPVFNEHAAFLVKKLLVLEGMEIDIVPVVTACALDIICETIMGVRIGAQEDPNNNYCRAVAQAGECWLERLIQPTYWLDSLYYKSKGGKRFVEKLHLLHNFTRKVIHDRKNNLLGIKDHGTEGGRQTSTSGEDTPKRMAFMDLLLDQHLNGEDLNEEGIREEVDTFMFEGHDTTSMALSWIIHLLGHHQDVQEKLWPEVDAMFDELQAESASDSPTHIPLNKLKDLKYLDCVVKEGLRLYPSVPMIGRRLNENMDIKAGGKEYTLPPGTIVFVFIYMLHRDPDIFPKPETFNPDRFLPENSVGRNPFAFVPFSAGPRNCIGQRFALAELKIVLSFLLRSFRFESLEHRDKILANMEMVLRPKVPIRMKLHPRSRQKIES